MHIAQVGFVKGRNVVHTISKNTSCNSGWLRLVVQIIFGTLIVSSFVLIMLMVVGKPSRSSPTPRSRCSVTNCRVVCTNAPYYGDYEEDIINAASEADVHCESIVLKLIGPTFKNFQISSNWLWSMNANVRELAIYGGNLKQISPDAFMSPFGRNIKLFILEEIEINAWEKDMLVGLSSLEKLIVRDCILLDIRKNALAPLDDSLKFLEIKATNNWDPVNVTGTTRLLELTIVDFSSNDFHNILGNKSFSQLRACEVLFLNNCQIVSLNPGTFDYMDSLEILYLNDNLLVTVPVGLFDIILPLKPRIALQDNLWHCDCSRTDLRSIVRKELLIVDPICHAPITVAGMTFTDFEGYCKMQHHIDVSDEQRISKSNPVIKGRSRIIYLNGACHENASSNVSLKETLRVESVSEDRESCLLNRINVQDIQTDSNNSNRHFSVNWIKPVFFVENYPYSMVEITSIALPGYGLLWYQPSCADTIYCVNTIPHTLKVFNIHLENFLTFCLFNLSSGIVITSDCLSYNLANMGINTQYTSDYHELIWFICLSIGCLLCGAICVYGMIQKNPTLLKGSKRVLIVKHKSVDALILPPKVPIRKVNSSLAMESNIFENNKIFVLPNKLTLTSQNFNRSISIKSNASNDASYISALQPTEEQLFEWRSKQSIKQTDHTPSSDFSIIPYTSMYEKDSLPYYSFDKVERVYEVPK